MEEIKFEILSTSTKGRSIFARQRFAANEVILQEAPLVSSQFSWNKAYGYLACDNCMYPLETAEENLKRLTFDMTVSIPLIEADPSRNIAQSKVQCQDCCTKFCSSECMMQAEKQYHKLICHNLQPNQSFDRINEIWKKMHYPPETSSVLLVFRIFAMIKSQPELIQTFNEFCDRSVNEDYSICHKILGERFTDQLSELHQAFVQVFSDEEILGKYLTIEGLTQLFAMIGTNSQGIGTSSFASWVKSVSELTTLSAKQRHEVDELIDAFYMKLEDTVGHFLNNEGSGLYVTQSKINHSCNPNAEIRFPFSNYVLQVVALREIQANEEISISYLDECQLNRSRHSRQKYLQENYLFLCECEKCQEEIGDPDVTSDEEEEEEEGEEEGMNTDDDQ